MLEIIRYKMDPKTNTLIRRFHPRANKMLPIPGCLSRRDKNRRRMTQVEYNTGDYSIRDLEYMFDDLTNTEKKIICYGLTTLLYRPDQGLDSFLQYYSYPEHQGKIF